MDSSVYSSLVLALRMERSNSRPGPCAEVRSSFFALTMARFTSNRRACVPGRGRVSKFVADRNLYRMEAILGCVRRNTHSQASRGLDYRFITQLQANVTEIPLTAQAMDRRN